ncbi:MAG: deoxyribose-phosphate aldolase, partial [Deltaproteobacteria bacterium]|nr:deoxyribose-phosphate aldolase [Deltaproteobacteria bacterium]
MPAADPLDQLVEEIERRVRARLIAVSAAPAAAKGSCEARSCRTVGPEECDACRGCHVNRPEEVREIVKLGAARIAAGVGHQAPAADLAALIDHTLLKPDATREELKKLCDEAKRFHFATVCVNPANVRYCAALLEGSGVKPIAVVGFPLGAATPNAKACEAREAVRNGAQEIDMVLNVGALKSRDYALVLEDVRAVVAAVAPLPVKVILETALLDYEQKVIACALAKIANAAYVKTSTGFGPGGATVEDVELMRRVVGPEMGVKASGGVRTTDDARKMVAAGATRLGASASVSIVTGNGQAP